MSSSKSLRVTELIVKSPQLITPSVDFYASILQTSLKINDSITIKLIHNRMIKSGIYVGVLLMNNLVNSYAKTGFINDAHRVFDEIPEKDTSSYNTLMSAYAKQGYNQHGLDDKSLSYFSEMFMVSLLKPDRYTLTSVLSACANLEELEIGKQTHAYIIRNAFDTSGAVGNALISMYSKSGGVETAHKILLKFGTPNINIIAFTALLDGYAKLGDVNPARKIFDSLVDCDVVGWTAMIVGYAQNGHNNEAMELFRSMMQKGPMPNSYTLAAMLSVSSDLASLNHGKQIHATALKLAESSSISVSNSLINMYAKAGTINCARKVFSLIQCKREPITWSSMIMALAQHGLGEEALQLFADMLSSNVQPDHITYVGVLSACTHIGLVEKGRTYYQMMKDVHGIQPTSSHCACMIDLFGRAGLLQEAQDFIATMPIEPDVIAWGSLLAACKIHKNVELAETAAGRLLSIEPDNSGAYSALANVYLACGKWKEAARIRKSMKDRQVKKEQGISWVQIKSEVHVFGADDGVHPQRDAIYRSMAKIWEEIKKMGFVPDTGSVLHDLDEELKEQILKHHSEKLAISFALMNTSENTTIRIMKNLRVCNDCHSAIKFISKLVDREIIVRDATRFHHFQNGSCSCCDYW